MFNNKCIKKLVCASKSQNEKLQQIIELLGNTNGAGNDEKKALLEQIKTAIINNTTVLKAELDEMQTAVTSTIAEVIATIDDGIEVTATQKGKWIVEVSNPTDLDALAEKVAGALDNLNVTIAGQKADLNVNVTNDKLTVTVDNFPTPTDYSAQLEAIKTAIENQANTNNANKAKVCKTHLEQYTTETTTLTDKKDITVTVRKGTVDISVNGANAVTFGQTNDEDVTIYKTEKHNGNVTVTGNANAQYLVEYTDNCDAGATDNTTTDNGGDNGTDNDGSTPNNGNTDTPTYNYKPMTKAELQDILLDLIPQRGLDGDYNDIDTSAITEMAELFSGSIDATATNRDKAILKQFNGKIDKWIVSNVTNMKSTFENNEVFNQPLNNWDVSNVTTMYKMFKMAKAFNQPLNKWNVHNVTDMYRIFFLAQAFNQNIGNWDVSNVTNSENAFYMTAMEEANKPKFN